MISVISGDRLGRVSTTGHASLQAFCDGRILVAIRLSLRVLSAVFLVTVPSLVQAAAQRSKSTSIFAPSSTPADSIHRLSLLVLAVAVGDRSGPTPTFITLLSADANHSFWIPRLTGKTDLIANHPNSTWIDPHEPELYLGQCALYCGTQHAKMLLRAAKPPIIDVNILRAPQSARGFELTRHRSPVIQL